MLFRIGFACRALTPICLLVFLLGQHWLPPAVADLFAFAFMILLPLGLITIASDALLEFWQRRSQLGKDSNGDSTTGWLQLNIRDIQRPPPA